MVAKTPERGRARTAGDVQKPKSKKGRTVSSQRWLQRQFRDPFVADAKAQGYRSRAAFKLIEIDDKFHLLRRGARVLDLGAAPGGWTQVAVERVEPQGSQGAVFAIDQIEITPIAGAEAMVLDMNQNEAIDSLPGTLGAPVDVVLSDMAPAATGHRTTDALRLETLAEAALAVAQTALKPGGALVVKLMRNGHEMAFVKTVSPFFAQVKMVKPKASRQESSEIYLVATGFKG